MSAPETRRGFLRGLTTLPLIGGGVTLIGTPTSVAEPVTLPLMNAYVAWLAREHGRAHDDLLLMLELEQRFYSPEMGAAGLSAPIQPAANVMFTNWPEHQRAAEVVQAAPPSTRAALVLSAVGCDWRWGAL